MGINLLDATMEHSTLSGNARLVVMVVAEKTRDTHQSDGCWPRKSLLMRWAGIKSEGTLDVALAKAEAAGELKIVDHGGLGRGDRRPNRYIPLITCECHTAPQNLGGRDDNDPPISNSTTPQVLGERPPNSQGRRTRKKNPKKEPETTTVVGLTEFITAYPRSNHSASSDSVEQAFKNAVRDLGIESVMNATHAYAACIAIDHVEPQWIKKVTTFLADPWGAVEKLYVIPPKMAANGWAWGPNGQVRSADGIARMTPDGNKTWCHSGASHNPPRYINFDGEEVG